MRRGVLLAVLGGLFIGGLPASATPTQGAPLVPCKPQVLKLLSGHRDMEVVSLRDFYIEASVKKKSYKVGDTIQFPVRVSRPSDSDPLGLGVPTDPGSIGPAEEVNIGVGLLVGEVFLPGFAVTDANGEALIKVKVESYVKPATVDAAFYAWKVAVDTPCVRVEENGFRPVSRMFKITR